MAGPEDGTSTAEDLPGGICLGCAIVHIHVDANRDGVIDDTFARNAIWTMGTSGSGAILCVNTDNDDGKSGGIGVENTDLYDSTINGGADLPEIAPLDLRKQSELPLAPATVTLSVDPSIQPYVRIFDSRGAGASEIIGPDTAAEKTFSDADFGSAGKIELGMEAVSYPFAPIAGGPSFGGTVVLSLAVMNGTAVVHSETATLRVAPWQVFSHFDETEKVYVAKVPASLAPQLITNDDYFISALQRIIAGKLVVVEEGDNTGDRWAQDVMEVGYSAVPGHDLVTVIRTPADRSSRQSGDTFAQYPGRVMLDADLGYYESNAPFGNGSLDSFGNLECAPPTSNYPAGRIIYGTPASGDNKEPAMKSEMRALLNAQQVQPPIELDTGWLTVGHVDEFLSFIPDQSGTHGFKVAFASPALAMSIIVRAATTLSTAPMFDGITNNDGSVRTIRGVVPQSNSYEFLLNPYVPYLTAGQVAVDKAFAALQARYQGILDAQRQILKTELDLVDSDFIHLPIPFRFDGHAAVALTPGTVNMLVVTKGGKTADLVIPKPFGPVLGAPGTKSEFEKVTDTAFAGNSAVTVHYVDCFLTYHMLYGEIHCGTNSKRKPPARKWWH